MLLRELGLTLALLPPVVSHLTQGERFRVLQGVWAEDAEHPAVSEGGEPQPAVMFRWGLVPAPGGSALLEAGLSVWEFCKGSLNALEI